MHQRELLRNYQGPEPYKDSRFSLFQSSPTNVVQPKLSNQRQDGAITLAGGLTLVCEGGTAKST